MEDRDKQKVETERHDELRLETEHHGGWMWTRYLDGTYTSNGYVIEKHATRGRWVPRAPDGEPLGTFRTLIEAQERAEAHAAAAPAADERA